MKKKLDLSKHPCFNDKSRHTYARIHLPIAPKCNIQCNFCNRKYDCVNETRPGVTSAVLSPWQALEYLKNALKIMPQISVVGIAGPGDPFANPEETMQTLELISKNFPDLMLCVASNGLNIHPYIESLSKMNVSHVTITVNAIDPEIAAKIYAWVRAWKTIYRGRNAGEVLIERQISAIQQLKKSGITVKVNTIIIPGINDSHIEEVAKAASLMGVDIMNCIPLYPAKETEFENIESPSNEKITEIRSLAGRHVKQMAHCTRCRADAVGLLGDPMPDKIKECLMKSKNMPLKSFENRKLAAVVSREGVLVNQHLGEAFEILIYERINGEDVLIEKRKAPSPGSGDSRWEQLAELLKDCRLILVGGAGPRPAAILGKHGLEVVIMEGMIKDGLAAAFGDGDFSKLKKIWAGCGGSCSGKGMGCS